MTSGCGCRRASARLAPWARLGYWACWSRLAVPRTSSYADERRIPPPPAELQERNRSMRRQSGAGGSSPVDSGPSVVADATQADVVQADVTAPCANVVAFDIGAEADSIIAPENGNCTYLQGSINHGPDPALLVGLADCPNLSEGIIRFPVFPKLASAFASGDVLDVALVLTGDPAYNANFVAGHLNVFAMTSEWDEGMGSYDGAQWFYATTVCGCTPHSNACCDYQKQWASPGASGTADRNSLAAASVSVPSAPNKLSIDLDPHSLGVASYYQAERAAADRGHPEAVLPFAAGPAGSTVERQLLQRLTLSCSRLCWPTRPGSAACCRTSRRPDSSR